jgi:hypothetical protein
MRRSFLASLSLAGIFCAWVAPAAAQAMPASLAGTWKIVKILPTRNPTCWGQDRARTLVGSTLRYGASAMMWQGGTVPVPDTVSRTLSRRKFMDEYKVDLSELGIGAPSVLEFDLQHEDADVTGATTEVPGDTIVLAGPGRIIVSACGVFYSAVKLGKPMGAH